MGAGAVLSLCSPVDKKLHPCAFFSHRLFPADPIYDVGDWELLAVKLALEDWRHWLEGAEQPFVVWMGYKNLEYIHSVRSLNPRQARWAIFFGQFKYVLTYRPGSKNIKPGALPRLFTKEESSISATDTSRAQCLRDRGSVHRGSNRRLRMPF